MILIRFTVMLVDSHSNLIENTNRIPLAIGIYSSENPPKYIDSNTAGNFLEEISINLIGNKILKGYIEKDLTSGTATFDKIQIKEVTSHFRNGWIFFVVYPKINKSSSNPTLLNGNGQVIDASKIKPLILEKVIVKAKKTKDKDDKDDKEEREDKDHDGSPSSIYHPNDTTKEDIFE